MSRSKQQRCTSATREQLELALKKHAFQVFEVMQNSNTIVQILFVCSVQNSQKIPIFLHEW